MTADLFSVEGKKVVVTGGSGGIGRMIATGFLEAGARVLICGRDAERCARAVEELQTLGACTGVAADVAAAEGRRSLVTATAAWTDRLDVLVNNAGKAWRAAFGKVPLDAWDKVFDVNVKAPFFLTQELLPLLRGAAEPDPARVINVGSLDGLRVTNQPSFPYGASKAALHHVTRVLARRLGPERITVNSIAPGPFRTRGNASLAEFEDEMTSIMPLGRIGEPSDIAGTAIYLSSRAGAFVTGSVIAVDGGLLLAYTTGRDSATE
jgi:NAD(P)-dependent dehydrogenase (short-subunit alcohol dehydrogenase family)